MKKSDLERLEADIMAQVVKRRALGGYSAEAEGLMFDGEALLKMIRHLVETAPRSKNHEKD